MQDEKLRIALEALLKIKDLSSSDLDAYHFHAERITWQALQAIQREHYLGEPSPIVAELVGARRL